MLIEFAVVFALFVFILYALIAFGMALALKHTVTHSAAEGARAAVGIADDPGTPTDDRVDRAKAEVADSMDWLGPEKLAATTVDAVVAGCASEPTAECITVEIIYPYEDHPVVPHAPGLGLVTPETMTSTAVVKLSN